VGALRPLVGYINKWNRYSGIHSLYNHQGGSIVRKQLFILAFVAILVAFSVSQVFAQSELTLEGLAEQVVSLVQRVEALESLWDGPGSVALDGGGCVIVTGTLQRETAIKYYDQFEEFPDRILIETVAIQPEENKIAVLYTTLWGHEWAWEYWIDCEFVGSSDWERDE